VEAFLIDSKEPAGTIRLARQVAKATFGQLTEIDQILVRHSRHWELGRLALVDRNILRLATWELVTRKAPYAVIISEATRLAQEFSTVDSPRFVNGVLDAVTKELGQDTKQDSEGKPV